MEKHILSIDDDEDILYTIHEICQSQGWVSLLARSFQEAERIIQQRGIQSIDLILIDYHLPQVDGISAVRRIRGMGVHAPVIVLTIEEQRQVMEQFLEAGADDYSVKPIRLVDLVSRINTHLRYSEKETAAERAASIPLEAAQKKGINPSTLDIIVECLKCGDYMDVDQIQAWTQLNAKTIHRYLFYLVREKRVETKNIYGKRGRPKAFYKWNDT